MTNWNDFLFLFAVFAGWFVLVRWVLPWMGISTCCSCSCAIEPPTAKEKAPSSMEDKENQS